MTNVMVKTCLHQKIIKKSNLIQTLKNSVCPKAEVIRRRKLSEGRILPKAEFVPIFTECSKCGLNTRHDSREVTWRDSNQYFRKPNLSEYFPNVPECGLNTRHSDGEVTLIHLTRAHTWRSDKCATGSIHANGSMIINFIPWYTLMSMSCTLGNSSSL